MTISASARGETKQSRLMRYIEEGAPEVRCKDISHTHAAR